MKTFVHVLVAGCVALIACIPASGAKPMRVTGSVASDVEFVLDSRKSPTPFKVNEVIVAEETPGDAVVWKMNGEAELPKLVYGVVPQGMTASVYEPLQASHRYQVVVRSALNTRNSIQFFCSFGLDEAAHVISEGGCT